MFKHKTVVEKFFYFSRNYTSETENITTVNENLDDCNITKETQQ